MLPPRAHERTAATPIDCACGGGQQPRRPALCLQSCVAPHPTACRRMAPHQVWGDSATDQSVVVEILVRGGALQGACAALARAVCGVCAGRLARDSRGTPAATPPFAECVAARWRRPCASGQPTSRRLLAVRNTAAPHIRAHRLIRSTAAA